MDGTTHLTIGALTGAALLRAAPVLVQPVDQNTLLAEGVFVGAAAFAALLADIDHPGSTINRATFTFLAPLAALAWAWQSKIVPLKLFPIHHVALWESIFISLIALALMAFSLFPVTYQNRGPTAPPLVGRRIPFTEIKIWHRGQTHSLVAAGIAGVLTLVLFHWVIALAVLAGYLSHIGVDLLNQSKVMVLWLIRRKKPYIKPRFPRWRAGGGWDYLTGLAGTVGLFLLVGPMVAGHYVHMPALKFLQAAVRR